MYCNISMIRCMWDLCMCIDLCMWDTTSPAYSPFADCSGSEAKLSSPIAFFQNCVSSCTWRFFRSDVFWSPLHILNISRSLGAESLFGSDEKECRVHQARSDCVGLAWGVECASCGSRFLPRRRAEKIRPIQVPFKPSSVTTKRSTRSLSRGVRRNGAVEISNSTATS